MSEPAAIEVSGYRKMYDGTLAVSDLTFHVAGGHILGLVGPNGAGKTTTIRALCGIITPTEGRLSVGGFDLATQPTEAKRRLAYIPDEPMLFETLTVWEHLQFTSAAYEVEDWPRRAEQLLAEYELTAKRDALAQELSRGMRQKVAICCAYLRDSAAIIFDEPLTGLDPRAIRTLKQSIRRRAEAGAWGGPSAAVIISSHLLSLIEDICTDLLILHRGRSLFFGPIAQARAAFADLDADASLEEVFFRATEERDGMSNDEARMSKEARMTNDE